MHFKQCSITQDVKHYRCTTDSRFEPGNGYPKNGYSERHIGNMIWPFVNKAEWTGITLSIVKSCILPLKYEKCIPVVVKYY